MDSTDDIILCKQRQTPCTFQQHAHAHWVIKRVQSLLQLSGLWQKLVSESEGAAGYLHASKSASCLLNHHLPRAQIGLGTVLFTDNGQPEQRWALGRTFQGRPPADLKDANQPPQLSSEQMESLAAQVMQTILKQLAGSDTKVIGNQQAGSSSSSQPGKQGEHGML